jgi:hypothetical protein
MYHSLAADLLVVLHLGFVLFVAAGGLAVLRWPRLAWAHVPVAFWGAMIEFAGWVCPLTPLENWLRLRAGEAGYAGGFVEHYLVPLIYPPGLTRGMQIALGIAVVLVNASAYTVLIVRRRRAAAAGRTIG